MSEDRPDPPGIPRVSAWATFVPYNKWYIEVELRMGKRVAGVPVEVDRGDKVYISNCFDLDKLKAISAHHNMHADMLQDSLDAGIPAYGRNQHHPEWDIKHRYDPEWDYITWHEGMVCLAETRIAEIVSERILLGQEEEKI